MSRYIFNACLSCTCLFTLCASSLFAQSQWTAATPDRSAAQVARRDVTPLGSSASRAPRQLSSEAGQVWSEYDIRSFTNRLRDQEKPEQELVDWILRETGTDTWFGGAMSMLNANSQAIRVYHTPEVQQIVKDVVDRFVGTRPEANEVAVRLITVDQPDWRVRALPVLEPVKTQTPGIEAWLVSREDAALLLHELSRRPDFREHNSPNLKIYNGQTHVINSTRPRLFQTGIPQQGTGLAGLSQLGQVEEGFNLQISPLVSRDGLAMEAVLKCKVDQVEQFTPLSVNNVDQYGMVRRSQVQVPQISSWQLHERFRWPMNEVLLISRGRVATPGPAAPRNPLQRMFAGGAPRAEALLFLESRSEIKRASNASPIMATRTDASNYRGRY